MWQNAKDHSPKPMTVLAALFRRPEEVEKMDIRLKVSREEKTLALFLVKYRWELRKSEDEPDSLKPFTDFIIDVSFSLSGNFQIFHVFYNKERRRDLSLRRSPEQCGVFIECSYHVSWITREKETYKWKRGKKGNKLNILN